MRTIELEESSMSFKTEDGNILLISKNDVKELATKIVVESMINEKSEFYIMELEKKEKCNLLYKIVTEQKDTMSKKVKEYYLKAILEFLS